MLFENFTVDGIYSGIYASYYEIINCGFAGTHLWLSGSFMMLKNSKLGILIDISASYSEIRNNTFNRCVYLTFAATNLVFKDNVVNEPYYYPALKVACKNSYIANNMLTSKNGNSITIESNANGNMIYNNSIRDCTQNEIKIASATNNTLTADRIENCRYGIYIVPGDLEGYFNNIDSSNTINGHPVLYIVNESDKTYTGSYGFVGIVNCTNVSVDVYSTQPNYHEVVIAYTNDSSITVGDVNSSSY